MQDDSVAVVLDVESEHRFDGYKWAAIEHPFESPGCCRDELHNSDCVFSDRLALSLTAVVP